METKTSWYHLEGNIAIIWVLAYLLIYFFLLRTLILRIYGNIQISALSGLEFHVCYIKSNQRQKYYLDKITNKPAGNWTSYLFWSLWKKNPKFIKTTHCTIFSFTRKFDFSSCLIMYAPETVHSWNSWRLKPISDCVLNFLRTWGVAESWEG